LWADGFAGEEEAMRALSELRAIVRSQVAKRPPSARRGRDAASCVHGAISRRELRPEAAERGIFKHCVHQQVSELYLSA
jgi:hypothetical protein